jgi:hypothetical protein
MTQHPPTPQLVLDFDRPTMPLRWGKGGFQAGWPLFVGKVCVGLVTGRDGGFAANLGQDRILLGIFPRIQPAKDAIEAAFLENIAKDREWVAMKGGQPAIFHGEMKIAWTWWQNAKVGISTIFHSNHPGIFHGGFEATNEMAAKEIDHQVFGRAA